MKKFKSVMPIVVIAISLLFSSALPHHGPANYAVAAEQDQGGQVTGSENDTIDPEALAILKKATDYLTGLKQFHLKGLFLTPLSNETFPLFRNEGNGMFRDETSICWETIPPSSTFPPRAPSTSTSSRGWARRSVSRTSRRSACRSRGCW